MVSPYLYQPVIIFQEEAVQDLKHMSVSNSVSVRFFLLLMQGGSYSETQNTCFDPCNPSSPN